MIFVFCLREKQRNNKKTHIIGERSSCIDLIFASEPNLVVESGVQSSLHQNCHHQIVFSRFSLKVVFLPPYEREVWHFKKANIDHVRKAINGFQWEKSFQNTNVNHMVHLFNRTVKNIYVISFHMKQSHVTTEIHLGLIVQ